MDNQIFIPSISVTKEVRGGGGSVFWEDFWSGFSNAEEYNTRKVALTANVQPLVSTTLPPEANLYAEVEYMERAISKSKRPSTIWADSNLEVVESTDDHKFTLSGKKEDFEKLETIIGDSTFAKAKGTEDTARKNKIHSREIYAVAAIRNKNLGVEGRVDAQIASLMTLGGVDEIECIIELQPDQLADRYNTIYNQLAGHLSEDKVEKRDDHALFNNLSYSALLSLEEISYLLDTESFNYIRLIRAAPNFAAQRSLLTTNLSSLQINEPLTGEVFGVFDSGVLNPMIGRLRHNHEKFLKSTRAEDKEHGTFICSRTLFGEDIERVLAGEIDTLTPVGKYLDVQVLYYDPAREETNSDDDELLKALDEVTGRYPAIKVYNFSIADTNPLDESHPSELTEKLDRLNRERDVLFICVTGNNDIYGMVDYSELFGTYSNSTMILSPADTASNLTIGAIAAKVDADAACEVANGPSPFTRTGIVRQEVKKPDLVASGGNYLKANLVSGPPPHSSHRNTSLQRYGVAALSQTTSPRRDIGTSVSAPLVTREAVLAQDLINSSNISERINCTGNYANLIKALLVHSAANTIHPELEDEKLQQAYGRGVPNIESMKSGNDDEVTIVYCDTLDGNTKKHKLLFQLPDFVMESSVELTFTLAYNPPVDRNFKHYSMIDVAGTLRVPYPGLNKDGQPETKYATVLPGRDWTNHVSKKAGVSHFKKVKRNLRTNSLEVLVQMYAHEEYESKHSDPADIKQPYAICLTIKDLSASNKLKTELLQMNQIESLASVQVQNQAQAEV